VLRFLIVALIVLFCIRLAVGALRGQLRARSCCSADPRQDLRMRRALTDQPPAER
jgi:hypothetical protein